MHRVLFIALLSAAVSGCGGGKELNSLPVSFTMIEGSANEICSLILSPGYKGVTDLGSESDRLGMSLNTFMKEAEGGPYAEDAKAIRDKLVGLEKLAASRAPLAKQREAAKDLQATIAALKAKM